jgi:hypothetical protein
MCVMKPFFVMALAVAASAGAAPARSELAHIFAECVGRYSAEREHAWLTGNPDSEELEHRRAEFLALLQATVTDAEARRTLSYRIEVKIAHSSLLTQGAFGDDSHRAAQARHLAEHHLGTCRKLLLEG